MDFIPSFRFIASLITFGILMYMYIPIVNYLKSILGVPTSTFASIILFLWGVLAVVHLFASGIKLIMDMQRRKTPF